MVKLFFLINTLRKFGKDLGYLSRSAEFQGQVFSENILPSDLLGLYR